MNLINSIIRGRGESLPQVGKWVEACGGTAPLPPELLNLLNISLCFQEILETIRKRREMFNKGNKYNKSNNSGGAAPPGLGNGWRPGGSPPQLLNLLIVLNGSLHFLLVSRKPWKHNEIFNNFHTINRFTHSGGRRWLPPRPPALSKSLCFTIVWGQELTKPCVCAKPIWNFGDLIRTRLLTPTDTPGHPGLRPGKNTSEGDT